MKNTKEDGITLVALVISIIVMLILAGVSLNSTIGENGIIKQAQNANFAQKIARYKEELETNIVNVMAIEGVNSREHVNVLNENVKKYIPSLEENDIVKYGIIAGELYYLGETDENEYNVAKSLGLKVSESGKTKEEFLAEIEGKAIELLLRTMTGDSFTATDEEGNSSKIGVELCDKNFTNGDKWKIITEVQNNETKAVYGTGWYYVETGSIVDEIGKLSNSYILNYDQRKAVKFDANKHAMLAVGAGLAVKKGLFLNIDPTNMSDSSIDSWGDVTLLGFSNTGDYDENDNLVSGWDGTSIKLDGKDDAIVFNGEVTAKGFSFSYYGNAYGALLVKARGGDWDMIRIINYNTNIFFDPLFYETKKAKFFYQEDNNGSLCYKYPSNYVIENNEDFYLDITIDFEERRVSYYRNGKFLDDIIVTEESCSKIFNYLKNSDIPWNVGRVYGGNPAIWHYGKQNLYAIRCYDRALTSEEIKANYNATIAYHNILVNGGDAETSGETGGSDFEGIE